ncbi:MAG: ABC transporter ATP-binding protein [Blautia sp.]|nr:ABC transporter ATP-binding protein [Blautia sp.]
METILQMNAINASYGEAPILQDIRLTLGRNKIVGLVGESGSGKSTMARVITGLLKPASGEMIFEGEPLTQNRSRETRRKIQMVFQNPEGSLNPRHTIGKTLTDAMKFHGRAQGKEAMELAAGLLKRMELPEDSLKRYPHAFSGGQKQRIALARALAVEPDLLIADEPTSALDVSVQLTMLELMKELQQERNLTVLFISHDLGVIHYICDEVAVMKQGRILETGATEQFFRNPETAYGRNLLDSVPRINL